ncbi:hypothetical protein APS_1789 [Acetobacter pasteurianus subsp. pasteurianus LMG 1262 = NBRC 106471]|uniref:Uncharacterized protein n=1 Tax=Acetobacter pasteurianus (strain NBRC 105184 / IFO 3283-01) TaxID=634452 RepID=C7JCU0_ACEP3|nr:hypothetical protein APA01_03920 [Acetobacter pasteurianus IFO 3283-01]BAI01594.1 hypothetical protein APA03_03920 [Acetobacter pasteurianus IFO 3283-03]BAI04642.1 hypothetical protein APA07_03920 [Acetobacter pasteurianus IFO 3283-07]BAI07689.1 hypothetical protein APA22_03920 [Acetobacter pasteurianus IFO 3283-22]BAI10737.1 hypothetical protein APA26_03920 [Acetobacter pasteurianus IFO 3283-26]BAI13785.1 hypothetical protein APA32_03920 [Acetobacter pasteurianus IFO 3283-32]BAI16831.1 hy
MVCPMPFIFSSRALRSSAAFALKGELSTYLRWLTMLP